MGGRAAEQDGAVLVGDGDGVAQLSASAKGDGDVDLTIKLSIVDEAIVVGIFGDHNRWGEGGTAAHIQGGAVITRGGVARRVGDVSGDD